MNYSPVSGWMLDYFYKFATGTFKSGMNSKQVSGVFNDLMASPVEMIIWLAIIVVFGFFVCSRGLQKGIESVAFANGHWYRHWDDSVFCTASNAGLADGYDGLYFRLEYTACDDCIGCQRGTGKLVGSIADSADLLGQLREIAGDSAGSYGNVPLPAICIYGSADGCFAADSCTGCCNVYTAMSSTWLK